MSRIRLLFSLTLALGCATDPPAAPDRAASRVRTNATYKLVDVSPTPTDDAWATAINDRGQIVGWSNTPAGARAWVWVSGAVTYLRLSPAYTSSQAYGISSDGQVVGVLFPLRGGGAPAYWSSRNAVPVLLPTIGGTQNNIAFAVNTRGRVVGIVGDASGQRHAFVWEATTGQFTQIGALGGPTSQAFGVNEKGTVTGCADGPTGGRAFRWTRGGGMVLADNYFSSHGSCGYGINTAENVAGYFQDAIGGDTTALFDRNGFPQVAHRIGGANATFRAVNDSDVAVGYADQPAGGVVQGLVISPTQGVTTLRSLAAGLEARAFGVNRCGSIVGYGNNGVGAHVRALLWLAPGC